MPYAANLIHTVREFYIPNAEYMSGLPFHNGNTFDNGGYTIFNAGLTTSSASIPASTIRLPNGTKYDPHQTYRAPDTPGQCVVSVILKPHAQYIAIGETTLNQTEAAIQAYHRFAMTALGERGTLYAIAANNKTAIATARLIGISDNQRYPKQVPIIMGGGGATTPGITYLTMEFTFDLITRWEFEF